MQRHPKKDLETGHLEKLRLNNDSALESHINIKYKKRLNKKDGQKSNLSINVTA